MKILDDKNTFEYIKQTNCSVARYGDGEVMCFMLGNSGIKNRLFEQSFSESLRKELLETFFDNNQDLLLCIFPCLTQQEIDRLVNFTNPGSVELGKKLNYAFNYLLRAEGLKKPNLLGDAFCFRKNRCNQEDLKEHEEILKEYFLNKKVLIVSSDLNDINLDYFQCKEEDHILIPSSNAYSYIDEIESKIIEKNKIKHYDVTVISAGPTATVLVNRLLKHKIRSFDVGQIKRWCKE